MLAVIIHVVALKDKVNPLLIAIVINGMNTLVVCEAINVVRLSTMIFYLPSHFPTGQRLI